MVEADVGASLLMAKKCVVIKIPLRNGNLLIQPIDTCQRFPLRPVIDEEEPIVIFSKSAEKERKATVPNPKLNF